jgi:hypothetical protein
MQETGLCCDNEHRSYMSFAFRGLAPERPSYGPNSCYLWIFVAVSYVTFSRSGDTIYEHGSAYHTAVFV